jgi:hypothetical protein
MVRREAVFQSSGCVFHTGKLLIVRQTGNLARANTRSGCVSGRFFERSAILPARLPLAQSLNQTDAYAKVGSLAQCLLRPAPGPPTFDPVSQRRLI